MILVLYLDWEVILVCSNIVGITWWGEVVTDKPSIRCWFEPFLSKNKLNSQLKRFLSEI